MMFATLFGTQMWVVGETFSTTGCPSCPAARSALRTMSEDKESFPFFIPLLWQGNENTSPGHSARMQLLGIGTWGGGAVGGTNTISQFSVSFGTTHYDILSTIPSPIVLDISYLHNVNEITVIVDVEIISEITTTDNRIIFLLTYDWGNKQPGNYYASVVRAGEQLFNLSDVNDKQRFSHVFNIDQSLSMSGLTLVAFVQAYSDNRAILQAGKSRISFFPFPTDIRSFNSENHVTIFWDAVGELSPVPDLSLRASEAIQLIGYNVYRDGVLQNENPVKEAYFVDKNILADETYSYSVQAVYRVGDETVESLSNIVISVSPVANTVQMGSGTLGHIATAPGPINTSHRSLRGQFMYTAEELRKAGLNEETAFSHIGFFIQTRPGLPLPQFRIRMRNTTSIDLSEHDDGPFDTTQVLASFNPPESDWLMIELQEPFVWNGVDNVLIDTAFPQLFIENRTGQVRINQAPNGYRYIRRSTSTIDAETTSFEDYRPQIRLITYTETTDYDRVDIPLVGNRLLGNFPNPFNPSTTIQFSIENIENVMINVYNMRGQRIRTLVNDYHEAGVHSVVWDGRDEKGYLVGSGIYLYRMETINGTQIQRMLLMK